MGLSAITSPHTSQKRISLPRSHALCSKLYFSTYYILINVHILCVSPPPRFPRWRSGKKPTRHCRRCRFDPWVRKIPWRRKQQPAPVFLTGKSHGRRSLVGYSPWGSQRVRHNWVHTHTHTHTLYLRSSSVRFWRGWFALQLCGRHCWGPKLRHFFPPPSRHHADYIQGSPLLHSVPWCLGHEESVNPDAVIPLINNWLPRCHGPILRSLRQEGNLLSSFRKRFPCF